MKALLWLAFAMVFLSVRLGYAQDAGATNAAGAQASDAGVQTVAKGEPEPSQPPPEDPLAIPETLQKTVGSDSEPRPPAAVGELKQSFFPLYKEERGDYRFRMVPPLYLDHTRGLDTPDQDQQSLYGLLYYRRRSPKVDADVVFPALWRLREGEAYTTVVGPLVHREAPEEHDNWLAPLLFEGARKDGGYFHAPLLLTTSHWNPKTAFTLVGPYFRDRNGTDVDWGIAPLYFHGDNGSVDGGRRTYTLIPPLLYYHREREIEGTRLTIVGPVVSETTPKRTIFDVLPFFWHIDGRPEADGEEETHTTLLPFFHYGKSKNQTLFVLPGYLRRLSPTADTMLTPFYSRSYARGGATEFTAAGPILPLFMNYRDKDVDHRWTAVWPLFYNSESPTHSTIATPLFAHSRSYGVSRSTWVFPSLHISQDTKGWDVNLYPLAYFGRKEQSSHNVLAPILWDFKTAQGRDTVAFPLFWRFSTYATDSVSQLAGNTLYLQKRAVSREPGRAKEWSFHVLPLFSYGEHPGGYFWNVLFGLAGYTREYEKATVRAFWLPIDVSGAPPAQAASR
jgi:hypothetical protein